MRFGHLLACIVLVSALGCARGGEARGRAASTGLAPVDRAPVEEAQGALVVTTPAAPFALSHVRGVPAGAPRAGDLRVDTARRGQTITAFGGAFNEKGWDALGLLAEEDRAAVLRSLFDPEAGLGFDWCRLPIGASDYAMDRYSLDESPGDYPMRDFTIDRDRQRLIPYVKAALRVRADLKFWGSAWTPPTWMKTNGAFDSGAMKDEPAVYAAYALYLAKFVESYAREGITVSMVVPQNEPGQLTHYPSCDWTPAQYVRFIRDFAALTFKERGLSAQLFVGTVNRGTWDAPSVLRDPGVARSIAGVTLQWDGLRHARAIHAEWPSLPILQSETECGNNPWAPTFHPDRPPNDFGYAAYTWRKFRDFFASGAAAYMIWNMVLDEEGKNIDSVRPWPQNAAVVVDRKTRSVTYTPMFWATKHFSKLVARGAALAGSQGAYADAIAFVNPDGSPVVELLNETGSAVSLDVVARGRRYAIALPPQSFATLVAAP